MFDHVKTWFSRGAAVAAVRRPRRSPLAVELLENRENPSMLSIHGSYNMVFLLRPSAPSLSAAAYSSSQVDLSWSAASGASGYLVYEWTGAGWGQIANLDSSSTGFAVTGLAASSTYSFDVAAYNAYGSTWATSAQTATTGIVVDHPTAATSYVPVSGSLFGSNGPSYLDVQQGQVGDCWLLASLAEVAARNPSDIQNMFTYVGTTVEDGTTVSLYNIRLFDSTGTAQYFLVDTELPSGGGTYDHPANGVLWVALAEKAYAQANGAGVVTTSYANSDSYDALNGGDPQWALQAITGNPTSGSSVDPSGVATQWGNGGLVCLCTSSPLDSNIVPDHCYAVVDSFIIYEQVNLYTYRPVQFFEIYNPWGTDSNGWALGDYNGHQVYGLFFATASDVSQNFDYQAYGTGTAAGMTEAMSASPTVVVGMQGVENGPAGGACMGTPAPGSTGATPGSEGNPQTPPGAKAVDVSLLRGAFTLPGNGGQAMLDALWAQAGHVELTTGFGPGI